MQIICLCCHQETVYLIGDNIGEKINYYGECSCGAKIDYDKDRHGNIVRDSTKCPEGN
jgi:hypothetical protein